MNHLHRTLLVLVISLPVAHAGAEQQSALPNGPGVNLVYAKCQQCHPISYVAESAGLPDFLWKDTLSLMKSLGMKVTENEEQKLYDYFTTYLGVNPPPEPAGDTQSVAQLHGEAIYVNACAVCHGPQGQGTSDAFPPLAGHAIKLAAADRSYLPLVVIYGLRGRIDVAGNSFDAVMPSWGHLSNEDIAAILNLVTAWDPNDTSKAELEPFTASEIERSRGLGLTPPEVHERRP